MAKAATATSAPRQRPASKAKKAPKVKAPEVYVYKGLDKKGNKVEGEITSQSPTIARATLIRQGVRAKTVKKKPKPLLGGGGKKITPGDIAVFSRQMATMMKAGVPLVQSFDIVADGSENPSMTKLIKEIREDVAAGGGFAKALEKHPKYFDELFCNLVAAGEEAGALETMLDRIAIYKEKSESTKKKVKKALTYPIAVLVVAVVVTVILLIKVVPQFAETFTSFGAELPAFTQFVMSLSELAQEYWFMLLIAVVALIFAFKHLKKTSYKFAYAVDKYIIKFPVFGDIIFLSVMARFGRTLSTTFAAGVPLIDALDSVAGAAGNKVYEASLHRVKEDVSTGTQMNASLLKEKIYPNLLIQMTTIGEESGNLDEMLAKVAEYYEEEVDNKVDNLSALLEPMIMAVLGVLVGGLMIAMYLPIFQMGNVV